MQLVDASTGISEAQYALHFLRAESPAGALCYLKARKFNHLTLNE